jgi:hypothetical protein
MPSGGCSGAASRRALELLGLDPEDRTLVERVRGYRRGRCLLRAIASTGAASAATRRSLSP